MIESVSAEIISICKMCGITTFGVGALLMIGGAAGFVAGNWSGYKLGKVGRRKFRKDILG